ncbi:MAG: ATP-grasp domain-containing protein [Candidatus Saccharimonas sp.]
MRLLEYEAKAILKRFSIPVPNGRVIRADDALPAVPTVVKSQIPVGGRGKAGGIQVVTSASELPDAIERILHLEIKGHTPSAVLCEELIDIQNEYYLSLIINRSKSCIELVAHQNGGVEVESNDAAGFLHFTLTGDNADAAGEALAELYGLPDKTFVLQDMAEQLYRCFTQSDATLLEINPLVLTTRGTLMAGDCKMELDNAAAFRHPEWDFEDKPTSANFVTLDPQGTVATIANGAGLAMATVDAVTAAGLTPANFLDIGGGATTARVVECFQQITEFPRVNAIVINIFGGIVQCDTVAQAIIEARGAFPSLPTLYIRLSGNRSAEAAELLQHEQLPLYSSLEECIQELTR